MRIKYIYVFIISTLLIIVYLLTHNKKRAFNNGSKIANTDYLKNTHYYKIKLYKYIIIRTLYNLIFITAIISSLLLLGRLSKLSLKSETNTDIIFCIDVSSSLDKENKTIIKHYQQIAESLTNTRIGITIFNTSAATISPLTNQHEYIIENLKYLDKSLKSKDSKQLYTKNFSISGTMNNYETDGTSLVGNGLISCSYNFNKQTNNKLIILSTDNISLGQENIDIKQAAHKIKKQNIKIIPLIPKEISADKRKELESISSITGSNKYTNNNIKVLINNINKDTNKKHKYLDDIPTIPFIILLSAIIILYILKKVFIWAYIP